MQRGRIAAFEAERLARQPWLNRTLTPGMQAPDGAGVCSFATMAVCVKFASVYFNAAELVFYRGLLGMLFMWLLARRQGVALSTQYAGMHAWRSLVGVISLGAWFYAIAIPPLATAMTLNYMSSVWVAAFLIGGALISFGTCAVASTALRQARWC